jgi:hypothetical protein
VPGEAGSCKVIFVLTEYGVKSVAGGIGRKEIKSEQTEKGDHHL